MKSRHPRRAAALLVCLAVLAVLVVLSTSFVKLQSLEREASKQHVYEVRAKLMARAGVSYAVARVRELAALTSYDAPDAPWIYRGEDANGDGIGDLNEDVFEPGMGLNTLDCPLESALAPSFSHPGNPARLAAGRAAVSGLLASPSGDFSDGGGATAFSLPGSTSPAPSGYLDGSFSLRVIDCASQLDVNGGRFGVDIAGQLVPLATPDQQLVDMTAAMIDRLWRAIYTEAGLGGSYDVDGLRGKGLGRVLMDDLAARGMSMGFPAKSDLEQAVRGVIPDPAVGEGIWRRIGPMLTCQAWRDVSTVRPVPSAQSQLIGVRRFERVDRQPRAPVNVNTADWKVLYAVLAGLRGRIRHDGLAASVLDGYIYTPDPYPEVRLDAMVAEQLARALVAYRHDRATATVRPFKNGNDLRAFLDGQVAAGKLTDVQADLVMAQAEPDTQLNSFGPDALVHRRLTKVDLIEHSTELAFSSMGYFEITSLGRVHYDIHTVSSAQITTVMRVYEVHRDTTYQDFAAGTLSELAIHPGTAPTEPTPAYDGRVGLRPIASTAPSEPKLSWKADFASPGENGYPVTGPLVGPGANATVLVDGAYSEHTATVGAYPAYERGKAKVDKKHCAIAFWYKPNWNIGGALRPHSILDVNGDKDDETFQLYFEGGAVDKVCPSPGDTEIGPRLVLLFWDKKGKREVKLSSALINKDGESLVEANQWLYLVLLWSKNRLYLTVNSQKINGATGGGDDGDDGDDDDDDDDDDDGGGDNGNEVIGDLTASGGPLLVRKKQRRGLRLGAFWNEDKALDDDGGLGPPPPPDTDPIFTPPQFNFGKQLRLGGPLKHGTPGRDPESPSYQGPSMAPSDGTYAEVSVYKVKDIKLTAEEQYQIAILPPDELLELALNDPDMKALQRVFDQGRYYNGETTDAGASDRFGTLDSQVLAKTAGHPLGTISWRALTAQNASVDVRVLRQRGGTWEEVPAAGGAGPLSFATSGACAIDRKLVDVGLASAERNGAIKYRVYFIETAGPGQPVIETPFLESVTVTVLSPPTVLEWRWAA